MNPPLSSLLHRYKALVRRYASTTSGALGFRGFRAMVRDMFKAAAAASAADVMSAQQVREVTTDAPAVDAPSHKGESRAMAVLLGGAARALAQDGRPGSGTDAERTSAAAERDAQLASASQKSSSSGDDSSDELSDESSGSDDEEESDTGKSPGMRASTAGNEGAHHENRAKAGAEVKGAKAGGSDDDLQTPRTNGIVSVEATPRSTTEEGVAAAFGAPDGLVTFATLTAASRFASNYHRRRTAAARGQTLGMLAWEKTAPELRALYQAELAALEARLEAARNETVALSLRSSGDGDPPYRGELGHRSYRDDQLDAFKVCRRLALALVDEIMDAEIFSKEERSEQDLQMELRQWKKKHSRLKKKLEKKNKGDVDTEPVKESHADLGQPSPAANSSGPADKTFAQDVGEVDAPDPQADAGNAFDKDEAGAGGPARLGDDQTQGGAEVEEDSDGDTFGTSTGSDGGLSCSSDASESEESDSDGGHTEARPPRVKLSAGGVYALVSDVVGDVLTEQVTPPPIPILPKRSRPAQAFARGVRWKGAGEVAIRQHGVAV